MTEEQRRPRGPAGVRHVNTNDFWDLKQRLNPITGRTCLNALPVGYACSSRAFFMTLWRPCSRNDGRSCGIRWG